MSTVDLPILKEIRDASIREAEIHAFTYAKELDVGPERVAAFKIYERIRTALRS